MSAKSRQFGLGLDVLMSPEFVDKFQLKQHICLNACVASRRNRIQWIGSLIQICVNCAKEHYADTYKIRRLISVQQWANNKISMFDKLSKLSDTAPEVLKSLHLIKLFFIYGP